MLSRDQMITCIDIVNKCLDAQTNDDLEAIWLDLQSLCNIDGMMASVAEGYERQDLEATSKIRVFGISDIWREYYLRKNYALIDPVVKYCSLVNNKVFEWQEAYDYYYNDEVAAFISDAEKAGLRYGYAVGKTIHDFTHTASLVSVSIDPNRVDESQHALIQQLLPHVNLILSRPSFIPKPSLNEKEYEVLNYAGRGDTYEEISKIMRVTMPTVVYYLKNISRKLKVKNPEQAVKKASMLGMIKYSPSSEKPKDFSQITFEELQALRLANPVDSEDD